MTRHLFFFPMSSLPVGASHYMTGASEEWPIAEVCNLNGDWSEADDLGGQVNSHWTEEYN